MPSLNALFIKRAPRGRYADKYERGLYLWVQSERARSWILRVQVNGHRRDIGLGPICDISLAEARELAYRLRKAAKAGRDPIAERDRDKKPIPTFQTAGREAYTEFAKGWTEKHAKAFLACLEEHAFPQLGHMRVDLVTAAHVREALSVIWISKPVMARKVRQRIGAVLDFAKSCGWRSEGAIPSKELQRGLARQPKRGNFPSMPYLEVPAFVNELNREKETVGRLALLFTILNGARSGEVRSMLWEYVDFDAALWRRPAELMKMRNDHVVTLSSDAVAILKRAAGISGSRTRGLVFWSSKGTPLSDMTLTKILKDKKLPFTCHGFRSSFRTFCAERMPHIPDTVAEYAISHSIGDETVRAYMRSDFLEMRRQLTNAWGAFCYSWTARRDV